MRTKNVVKALANKGWKVEFKEKEIYDHFDKKRWIQTTYFCKNDRKKVHFYDEDGYATCVQVQGINQHNDSSMDYFPGTWCNTIKMIISAMEW